MLLGETILSGAPTDGVSEFKVMQSGAGYYVGTTFFDPDINCQVPNSRETGYFRTYEEAEKALHTFEVTGVLPGQR